MAEPATPIRIAVVDDDEGVRAFVTAVLEDRGYTVTAFDTLTEATAVLCRVPPDLLITDVELPDGCGLDLVGLLRDDDGSRIPTIVLSGLKREGDYVRGFAAGAADYLAKPFSRDELLARCSIHLARVAARAKEPVSREALPSKDGLVFGRYAIERALGRGGFGEVYLAVDRRGGGQKVALKVMAPLLGEQQEARMRFIRETYTASGIRHPRIAALYDMGSEQGRIYYAMEYVPGPSLQARIQDRGALGEDGARALAHGLLDALDAVRAAGLVHRDLKPENVILRAGDISDPVIIDFGLAKRPFDRGITDAATLVGTASYLPPEAIRGQPVNHRSDLFSLGLTLRFALAGEEVFPDLQGIELLKAIATGPIAPPRAPLTPAFAALLASLLEIDPARRPETAGVALAALDALRGPAAG